MEANTAECIEEFDEAEGDNNEPQEDDVVFAQEPVQAADDTGRVFEEEAAADDNVRKARWLARRPPIEHLKDAVVRTKLAGNEDVVVPLFDVGDRIVVDCRTTWLKGEPWLYTVVGRVRSIDDDTGIVTLFDEESDPRLPQVRFVSFKDNLHILKLAPARGNPFDVSKIAKVMKQVVAEQNGEKKRGRGRPKGTLNRPKEVIAAEKEARKASKSKKK